MTIRYQVAFESFSLWQESHVSMYADDTAIKSIDDLQTYLNLDLLKLTGWLHVKQTFPERCENAIIYYRLWSKHP